MLCKSVTRVIQAAAVFTVLAGGAIPAMAQTEALGGATDPDVRFPDFDEPGQVERQGAIRRAGPASPPPGAEDVIIGLSDLVIEGMTVYPQSTFEPLYRNYLGREVTLATLYEVAGQIQARYKADGYFLSKVIVPAQDGDGGRFRLQVVEGYISAIEAEGAEHPSFRLARGFLNRAMRERPLRLRTLESALLLANDIPGLTVSVLLRQDPQAPGATVLVMLIDRKPLRVYGSIDNMGSVFTGRDTLAASVSSRARTRFGEEVTLTAVVSNPLRPFGNIAVRGSGSIALGASGLRLKGYVTYGESDPAFLLDPIDVKSETLLGGISLLMPIKRSRDLSLTSEIKLEALDSNTSSFGFALVEDRVRTLSLEGRARWNDRFGGKGRGYVEVRQGLPILDHSEESFLSSRFGASGEFTSVRAEIERVQRITRSISVQTAVHGQYSADNVLSAEEFTAGGRKYGRGYNEAEKSGDHGIGATLELRYSRASGLSWMDAYQVFAFADYAQAWRNDPFLFLTDDNDPLVSAGAGVRARVFDNFSLEFTLAKPLTRPTYRGGDEGKGRGVQPLVRFVGVF